LIKTIFFAGLLVGGVLLLVAFFVLVKLYRIPSSAMEPTLHCARPAPGCESGTSDRVAAVRGDWPFDHVGRGDIVVFDTPSRAKRLCGSGGKFVKRVVGLPGETWSERNGFVFIDGRRLREPYVKPGQRDRLSYKPHRIPKGDFLVLGDNRAQSCDSRIWGPVPRASIVAKVFLTYWPPGRISFR
jgi:signal peptidase I